MTTGASVSDDASETTVAVEAGADVADASRPCSGAAAPTATGASAGEPGTHQRRVEQSRPVTSRRFTPSISGVPRREKSFITVTPIRQPCGAVSTAPPHLRPPACASACCLVTAPPRRSPGSAAPRWVDLTVSPEPSLVGAIRARAVRPGRRGPSDPTGDDRQRSRRTDSPTSPWLPDRSPRWETAKPDEVEHPGHLLDAGPPEAERRDRSLRGLAHTTVGRQTVPGARDLGPVCPCPTTLPAQGGREHRSWCQ